jgi:hypothetical protein
MGNCTRFGKAGVLLSFKLEKNAQAVKNALMNRGVKAGVFYLKGELFIFLPWKACSSEMKAADFFETINRA